MKTDNIVLVLIGSVLVGSQFFHRDVFRDQYRSREDCQRDWQQNPGQCEPHRGGPYVGGVGRFVGPSYEQGARPRTAAPALREQATLVKRGGFGFSGARYSGGG